MGETKVLPKILVGFSGNPERTMHLDGHHGVSEKHNVLDMVCGVAGTSVNTAFQLRELGVPVSVMLAVGRDEDGWVLERELKKHKFHNFHLMFCRKATSYGLVHIDRLGRRVIESFKKGYDHYPTIQVSTTIVAEQPGVVVATGCISEDAPLVAEMFRRTPDNATILRVLNPRDSLCENLGVFHELLELSDLVFLNAAEFQVWQRQVPEIADAQLQTAVSRMHALGPQLIVITKDREGAVLSERGGKNFEIEAYVVGEEVDGTGAGDAFLAAFLYKYLQERSLEEAAQFATIVAGIKVTKLGGSNIATAGEISCYFPGWNNNNQEGI